MSLPRKFAFIAGCPRSGTSTIGFQIGSHPSAVIGHERYKNLARHDNKDFKRQFSVRLFEKERFFDYREEDTNHTPSTNPRIKNNLAQNMAKFDRASVVGDKVPHYFRRFRDIASVIPGCRFIFVLRELTQVCSSWNRNFLDAEKLHWTGNYQQALANWVEGARAAYEAINEHGLSVKVLSYDRYYGGDEDHARSVFDYLDLDFSPVRDYYLAGCEKNRETVSVKQPVVLEGQEEYLEKHADYTYYNLLLNQCDSL